MKTLKPKNKNFIPLKQMVKDAVVFLVNIGVIIGIYLLSIYINGLDGENPSFTEYFNDHSNDFFYLIMSLVLFMIVLMICLYFDDKSFFSEKKK